jgi:hypothetical protein
MPRLTVSSYLFFFLLPSVDRQFGWLALLRSAPGISRRQTGVSESEGFPSCLLVWCWLCLIYICYGGVEIWLFFASPTGDTSKDGCLDCIVWFTFHKDRIIQFLFLWFSIVWIRYASPLDPLESGLVSCCLCRPAATAGLLHRRCSCSRRRSCRALCCFQHSTGPSGLLSGIKEN